MKDINPKDGQCLMWNGHKWINVDININDAERIRLEREKKLKRILNETFTRIL